MAGMILGTGHGIGVDGLFEDLGINLHQYRNGRDGYTLMFPTSTSYLPKYRVNRCGCLDKLYPPFLLTPS